MNIKVVVTCTVTAIVVAYTTARCKCGRRLMDIPGEVLPEVRILASNTGSGRGRTIVCRTCGPVEVIEHRKEAA